MPVLYTNMTKSTRAVDSGRAVWPIAASRMIWLVIPRVHTLVCAAAWIAGTVSYGSAARAENRRIDFGSLVVTISTSRTAQVFHIVDQLANWDPYTHRAYIRWAAKSNALDDEDKKALARHAEMRKARGRGNGFEQAFLVADSIADAAANAVRSQVLPAADANEEAAILTRFSTKLAALIDEHAAELEAFAARIEQDRDRLSPLVAQIARLSGAKAPLAVPVFLVANTEAGSGGGEANANRLIVEVPAPDSRGTLLHESLHAFLRPRADEITAAAARAGLSYTELNEGIAYALSPGLTDEPGVDRIADQLKRFAEQGRPATDPYVRFYTIATVIKPVLRQSLANGEPLATFLPKAVAAWKTPGRGHSSALR